MEFTDAQVRIYGRCFLFTGWAGASATPSAAICKNRQLASFFLGGFYGFAHSCVARSPANLNFQAGLWTLGPESYMSQRC